MAAAASGDGGADPRRSARTVRARLAAAGLGLVVLAACGTAAPSVAATRDQQGFLTEVHDNAVGIGQYRSDPQLVQLGSAACDGFASGVSFQALADRLALEVGTLPTSDLGTVIVAAADHLCPAFKTRV